MITRLVIDLVKTILNAVFNLLPTGTLGFSGSSYNSAADSLGNAVGGWDGLFPIVFILNLLTNTLGIILPALLTYKVANWIWRHIPTIGGFGPGAG